MTNKRDERRQYRRFDLSCPAALSGTGETFAEGKTLNVSDGGLLVPLAVQYVPPCGQEVKVSFSVPRSTPNTYMLEEVECSARVVRHQPMTDNDYAAVGLAFTKPMELGIEV